MRKGRVAGWAALAALLVGPAIWSFDAARGLLAIAVCAVFALAAIPATGDAEAGMRELARHAFARTFEQPGVRSVDLQIWRGGRLVAQRAFEMAFARHGQTARSLVRFTRPDYLRGIALLVIEDADGTRDTWLYQPEERRPRRVGTAQKREPFYGSDLSLEDLERPHWERWRFSAGEATDGEGEPCERIDATPPPGSQYARLRIWVARRFEGVTRIDFQRDADEPAAKRLRVSFAEPAEEGGFLRVSRITVDVPGRDARTELLVERMRIDPSLGARLFSAMRLEREDESLFGLADRLAGPEPDP
jgi:hypothetical protein